MKKLIYPALLTTLLSGCALGSWVKSEPEQAPSNLGVDHNGRLVEKPAVYEEPAQAEMLGDFSDSHGNTVVADANFQAMSGNVYPTANGDDTPVNFNHAYGLPMIKNINHFVRGMMHSLVNNIHYINDKTPIGVASFIFLDGSFKDTNLLGNQIAESFMHEVHQFGIPVIDYKTTDYIRVTQSGDFIFSRDFLELKDELPIKYVLAGTLVRHQAGYIVNARIIGLVSKAIVASAQGFIPNAIADALMPSITNDGIMLMQGE